MLFKTCNCEATLFGVTFGSKSIFKILSETLFEIKTPINSHCKRENWLKGVCWGCLEQLKRCSFIYYAPPFGWGFQVMFSMFTAKSFLGGKIPPTGYIHEPHSEISTTGEACCSASRVFWLKHGVNVHLSDTWMFLSLFTLSVAIIWWKRLLYFRGKCGQSLHSFTDRWWMLQCLG